jgi:hypothetical protein
MSTHEIPKTSKTPLSLYWLEASNVQVAVSYSEHTVHCAPQGHTCRLMQAQQLT